MRYDQFKEFLADEVCRRVGEEVKVAYKAIPKNNGIVKDAMVLSSGGYRLSPAILVDDVYREYEKGVSMPHLARIIADEYEDVRHRKEAPVDFFDTYEGVREHLYCKLVGKTENEKMLNDVPYENWEDLAVICYYRVDPKWIEDATIQIGRRHLAAWNITEETLFRDAWENTLREFPPVFEKLSSVLAACGQADGIPGTGEGSAAGGAVDAGLDGESGIFADPEEPDENPLYLLSNRTRCLGAVCIAYPGETRRIARILHRDYYVIPSSIHECLILPDDGTFLPEEIDDLICQINASELEPQEVLSDHAYHYVRAADGFDN